MMMMMMMICFAAALLGQVCKFNVAWPQAACISSAERGLGVERPIAPGGAGEAVLEEHADDSHHSEAPVGDLGVQAPLPPFRVLRGEPRRPPAVPGARASISPLR